MGFLVVMKFRDFVLRRMVVMIPTLFGLVVIVFFLTSVIPTEPAVIWAGGPNFATPDRVEYYIKHVPCAEMVKFHTTGTEAAMYAIRLARAYTGKDKIMKFEGNYHGWFDGMLLNYKSPAEAIGLEKAPIKIKDSPGISDNAIKDTIVVSWNNPDMLEKAVVRNKNELAAVITEPMLSAIPPEDGYLKAMREITEENDVLLIFDEVKTGFRLGLGGAQKYYHVTPDLSVFGKAMATGFPAAAVAGKKEIIETVTGIPGGTFSANPLAMAAVLATLEELEAGNGKVYSKLFQFGQRMMDSLQRLATKHNMKVMVEGIGPTWQTFFGMDKKVRNYRDMLKGDKVMWQKFWEELMKRGVLFSPSYLMQSFIMAPHSEEDINYTVNAVDEALKVIKESNKYKL